MDKTYSAYKTIGEVVKIISSDNNLKVPLTTHTIRYWETQFKQIKPKIFNGKRRYYDRKNIELIKKVYFLLKKQGMTINGVKKILDKNQMIELDETLNQSIKHENLKLKITKISKIIKNLKKDNG
tara:strand:- start:1436 stop:1810 length:375 start_codon:yes stop_codon:yes gene_type:complete